MGRRQRALPRAAHDPRPDRLQTRRAGLFTAGAQVALDDVWRLGVAGGFQSSTLQTATGAQSEGSLAQGGVSLKYNPGPLLLAGAVTGGGAWYDTTRPMAFGGFTGVAEGEQDLGIFSAALRAAYVLGDPHLYFKPILDANLTHLELGGFTESGGNGAALSVDGGGHTVFSLAPMLEAGTEWWLGNGTLVRPLIRAGAVWYEGADFALTASFAGAPAGRLAVHHQHRHRRGDGPRRRRRRSDQRGRCGAAAVVRRPARRRHADPQRRHQGQRQVLAPPSIVQRSGVRRVAGANVRAKRAGMFSIAMAAAVLRGEPSREQTDEQRGRRCQPGQHRRLARILDRSDGILVGLIDPLLGVGLR